MIPNDLARLPSSSSVIVYATQKNGEGEYATQIVRILSLAGLSLNIASLSHSFNLVSHKGELQKMYTVAAYRFCDRRGRHKCARRKLVETPVVRDED